MMDDQNQSNQSTQTQGEDKIFQIGKYKVQVIRHLCIGAATCVAISPSTFQLDNENKAIIEGDSSDTAENILMAAQSCPTKAILVWDSETGQQIWPI
ncbi:MAG: ferredoxin [Actinobacteria bacterium]|nr:ferredoxin [Actinomycetota bacterium]